MANEGTYLFKYTWILYIYIYIYQQYWIFSIYLYTHSESTMGLYEALERKQARDFTTSLLEEVIKSHLLRDEKIIPALRDSEDCCVKLLL